jgi:integrase/recombinase XerD
VVLDEYTTALKSAPLTDQTRRTYASKVRQFLAWLADTDTDTDGDPLGVAAARDWAVGDYRAHLQACSSASRRRSTTRRPRSTTCTSPRLGPAARRAPIFPSAHPKRGKRAAVRFLRAVEASPSPRHQASAPIPFYAGTRIAEIVGLDVDDVGRSARKGVLRVYGKGARVREIPIHPQLRKALTGWVDERPDWPGADNPALF